MGPAGEHDWKEHPHTAKCEAAELTWLWELGMDKMRRLPESSTTLSSMSQAAAGHAPMRTRM